jgi:hypothetical protein
LDDFQHEFNLRHFLVNQLGVSERRNSYGLPHTSSDAKPNLAGTSWLSSVAPIIGTWSSNVFNA